MKKTALFVIALVLCILLFGLFINRPYATEVTVFEGTFTRSTSAPIEASKTFHSVSGLATVNLRNTRISSARVTINGFEVFGPSEFNQNVGNLEKQVTLKEGENSLTVLLRSGPEGALRIQIHMNLEVGITLDEANKVSATITPEGGTITAIGAYGAKFTLTFPAGALPNVEEITLTPVSSIMGLPLTGGMVAAVKMQPDGLNLGSYATLTLELPQPPQYPLTGFFLYDSGDGFYVTPAKLQGNTASIQLTHFTIGGWGPVACVDLAMLNSIHGLTPEQTAKMQMATLQVSYELCSEIPSYDEADRLIQDIHRDWYVAPGGVRQALADAESYPQLYLRKAVSQLNSWYGSFKDAWYAWCEADYLPLNPPIGCGCPDGSLCACGSLQELAVSAAFSVKRALTEAVKQEDATCSESAVLSWFDLADSLDELILYENSGANLFTEELVNLKTCGVVSLAMVPSSKTIEEGESFELKVEGRTQAGDPANLPREPGWFSTNPAVASYVASDPYKGIVTGESPGKTKISTGILTTSGGFIWDAESEITVTPGVKTLQIVASATTPIAGTSVQFQVKAFGAGGAEMKIDGSNIKWSRAPVIGSLGSPTGLITTLVVYEVGSVTVTASYKDGLKTASKSICFRAPIATIEVSPPSKTLFVGNTVHLTATAKNASGSTEFGCDFSPTFTWYSSNLNVATVDQNGNVRAVSKGVANITAVYGSRLGYSQITVFDMTGFWSHYEYSEITSGCPPSYESAICYVTQTGNYLTNSCGAGFTGFFTGPYFYWTLNGGYWLYPNVWVISSTQQGYVSEDGLSYYVTDSWRVHWYYVDENGNQIWQYCSGYAYAIGYRL